MENVNGLSLFERPKSMLFTLWIFLMMNYLYCDVLGLFDPVILKGIVSGDGAVQMDSGKLMAAAVLMEIPILMILLSKLLVYKANRWANISAALFLIFVQIGSLFVGSGPSNYYIFFSVIEIACCIFIAWYAWTHNKKEQWI